MTDIYLSISLSTHNGDNTRHNTGTSTPSWGFELAIPAIMLPQRYALDLTTTVIRRPNTL